MEDIDDTPYIGVDQFGNPKFHAKNDWFMSKYVNLRVRAVPALAAFRRVFGSINCGNEVHAKIQNLEASDMYNDMFEARLKAIPVDELLDAKKALHSYLEIANNPLAKDMAKIGALREAAVIAGVTVIDEDGKTKQGSTLADFYKAVGAALPAAPTVAQPDTPETRH